MNIVIICDIFPPSFAPRMGYLVKNLRNLGHDICIITEKVKDSNPFDFLAQEGYVHYINTESSEAELESICKKNKTLKLIALLRSKIGKNSKGNRTLRLAKKICSENSFDILLCSTYRTFPLLESAKISSIFKIPLVVDLRDIIEQYPSCEFISSPLPNWLGIEIVLVKLWAKLQIRSRNRALIKASAITTISAWHKDFLQQIVDNRNGKNIPVELIYNGFDHKVYKFEPTPSPIFKITYTGRIISSALRDPSLLLMAVENARKKEEEWASEVEIEWYCDPNSWDIVKSLSKKHSPSLLVKGMIHKDYVSASMIPGILNNSSVLLILTNLEKNGPKGVLTTKLFEALGSEKPILCIRSDESHIADILKESGQGLAANSVGQVESFLKDCYLEWKKNTFTHCIVKDNFLNKFHRDFQAKQFEIILKRIVHTSLYHKEK